MVLEVKNLSKNFGSVKALNQVTFTLEPGQALAITGINGAGKSTLLNCLSGTIRPDAGVINFTSSIGYLAHHSFLYDQLTVEQNLTFWAKLATVANPAHIVLSLISQAGLSAKSDVKVGSLSAGMQKRVSLCRAIVNDPALLLLDEPYAAFDQDGLKFLRTIITRLKNDGKIIIMATHFIEHACADCTHRATMQAGGMAGISPVLQEGGR